MSNHPIPCIGLGTGQMSNAESLLGHAIDCGYTLFDCASIYGNEMECGRALVRRVRESSLAATNTKTPPLEYVSKDDIFVISKVWNDCKESHQDIRNACIQSLENLQRDSLDLYLIHW